jgi:hypothetical protein
MEAVRSSETSVRHIPEDRVFYWKVSCAIVFLKYAAIWSGRERDADSFTYIKRGKSKDDRLAV